jgi:SAM-dependent methyltransferase
VGGPAHAAAEESFRVFQAGLQLFRWPASADLWVAYAAAFTARYGGAKLERARDLFESALADCPPPASAPLLRLYAGFEERHGSLRRALALLDRAAGAVPPGERYGVYAAALAKAAEYFGAARCRPIYERALAACTPEQAKVLARRFAAGVDVLEPSSRLLSAARARLAGAPCPVAFYAAGLQDFAFPPGRYSCVWLQWVVGTQLDADLVPLLAAAGAALAPGGVIVVKDNVARGAAWYDDEDSYVCRGEAYFRAVFAAAGLRVVASEEQREWDRELQRVAFFALAPAD